MNKSFETQFMEGEFATIKSVYEKYGPKVLGHVIKKGGSKEDGEEVFQMTLLTIRQNMLKGKYKEHSKFGHYLIKIAMNTWSNELKKRKKQKLQNIDTKTYQISDDGEMTLAEKIIKDKKLDVLEQALMKLGSACKEIIYQHYYNGKKLKDIALEQVQKESTIRVKLKRCRDKIKTLMAS